MVHFRIRFGGIHRQEGWLTVSRRPSSADGPISNQRSTTTAPSSPPSSRPRPRRSGREGAWPITGSASFMNRKNAARIP